MLWTRKTPAISGHTRGPGAAEPEQSFPRAHILSLIRDVVERTPSATAFIAEGKTLSYAELDAEADGLAGVLQHSGVVADAVVAVCLPRTLDYAIALLGVMKAGAASLSLDPADPEERLRSVVEDAAVTAIVTDAAGARIFSGTSPQIIDMAAPRPALQDTVATPLPDPRLFGLCGLYLGLDRGAERRRNHPSEPRQSGGLAQQGVRGNQQRQSDPHHQSGFRCSSLGDVAISLRGSIGGNCRLLYPDGC